jgi:hypothetical protein
MEHQRKAGVFATVSRLVVPFTIGLLHVSQ